VFVSDHQGLRTVEYLDGLLKDRFENSVHVDVIGSLLNPRGARVLELRPRTGAISESLRRLFGAEVHGMPIWESQRFLLKEVYGIDSPGLVNYDRSRFPTKASSISSSATTCSPTSSVRRSSSPRCENG
jgi:hypothetical protein